MIRGCTSKFRYVFANYATTNVKAGQLYNIVWDIIARLEMICDLKVLNFLFEYILFCSSIRWITNLTSVFHFINLILSLDVNLTVI